MPAPENHVPPNDIALNAAQSFYLATLGGAQALSLEDKIGTFAKGTEADFVVIDLTDTPMLNYRLEFLRKTELYDKLWETMFALMTMGDGRNIMQTYVMGKLMVDKKATVLKERARSRLIFNAPAGQLGQTQPVFV